MERALPDSLISWNAFQVSTYLPFSGCDQWMR